MLFIPAPTVPTLGTLHTRFEEARLRLGPTTLNTEQAALAEVGDYLLGLAHGDINRMVRNEVATVPILVQSLNALPNNANYLQRKTDLLGEAMWWK